MTDKKKKDQANQAADPVERKQDFSPFLKAAAEPPAEETPEEKAQREASEERIRSALEKIERINNFLRHPSSVNDAMQRALLDTARRFGDAFERMAEWIEKTDRERAAFSDFIDNNLPQIEPLVSSPEEITELKGYLFQAWYELKQEEEYKALFPEDIPLPALLKSEADKEGRPVVPFHLLVETAKRLKKRYEHDVPFWLGDLEELEEAAEELEKFSYKYPSEHIQNLTKANRVIFSHKTPLEDLKQVEFDVSPNDRKVSHSYSVSVDMSAPQLKGTENITEFDESVFNAAISVMLDTNINFFTPKQLAIHLLYGDNPQNSNPSPQRIGSVTKSIEKQRHVDIKIDWTDHARLNGLLSKDGDTFKVKNYMLPVKEAEAIINGQPVHGYKFIDVPPLYEYANSVNQIGRTPAKMLNVPVNLDEEKIVMRTFLLKEIAQMKRNPGWNKTITINRILETAGIDGEAIDRTKRNRLLSVIRNMLNYWKEQKHIQGYTENKVGKTVKSITIKP